MSSDKKEYPAVGATAPAAQAYIGVPGAPAHQVTMATPYPGYPASAYTSPAYLPSSAPTYLPASYATPLQHHLPYGTVAPNITAFGVPPTYMPQLTQVYSPRPGTVYVPAAATFDAGARFDGHSMPVVPPPPPNVAPNAAQLAMMQGNPVVLSQQKSSFLSGGSGAGFTFW
ncbi:DAZ-associated protein 2-like isoform X2 [Stegodyphus dumicola]|uniref:DAZ-associated protein 2-like isoform X2 n=1 Tax=Stegodyphus dumicola TaxID=202533 RepID=UPI0015AB0E66|nr:DAZ-associated protein 2-like isoform X2 [Stegodyphus dumicola]